MPLIARDLPGQPVQYLLSEISSSSVQQLALADGSQWRLTAARALTRGSPILISGRNLKTGAEAHSAGFSFRLSYDSGRLQLQSGVKLNLIAIQQDGKRLLLSEELEALVYDADRIQSRHFQGNSEVIISQDGQQLIYLPSLQQIRIRLLVPTP
jgi:hemin uptake protein HemP